LYEEIGLSVILIISSERRLNLNEYVSDEAFDVKRKEGDDVLEKHRYDCLNQVCATRRKFSRGWRG
jgi:hypothetical protein